MTPSIQPIQNKDRVIFMDVLRGFAILGIFIANLGSGFSGFNEEANLTGPFLIPHADQQMRFLHHLFIEGKFYSIFSLLFGWGIAYQIKRGDDNNTNVIPMLYRRLFFMLLLGTFHLLIWPGDIVFFYALLGFILIPFRKYSNRTLLIFALTLILLPIVLYAVKAKWAWLNMPAELLSQTGVDVSKKLDGVSTEAEYEVWIQQANWWDILKSNIGGFFFRYSYLFFVSRIPKVLGVFLIGFVIGRSDFYTQINQHKKIIYWVIGIGCILGLPANYLLAYLMQYYGGDYWGLKIHGWYQTLVYALGVVPLALAYVGLLMLGFETSLGKKILTYLAPVGKMAFSNYIMQSLIGNFVFLHAGLGFTGQVGPVYYTLFGLMVFAVQVLISTFWLRYFQYGPFEWLWRSLTYWKRPPFRINHH